MVDLGSRSQGAVTRIAVVMDVRSRAFSTDLRGVDPRPRPSAALRPRVLFLEATDDVLVRRFESVRRAHPLQGDGRLVDGIAAERELLRGAARRGRPGHRHQRRSTCTSCGAQIEAAFAGRRLDGRRRCARPCVSFGFKYGLPVDADLVVDVRFLPNPHWIPELRELTGARRRGPRLRAAPRQGADEFLDRYADAAARSSAPATAARASAT